MAKNVFNSLDLNLLRLFVVLSQELNMRKASERLHVSQPAVSQALSRLRHQLSDDLFVKVRTGLQPTPFAEEMYEQILPHMDALSNIINTSQGFDPKEYGKVLRIAIAPGLLAALSGTLYQEIKIQAPNATLELMSWNSNTLDEIKNGTTLLGVNFDLDQSGAELYCQKLVEQEVRAIVRKDHPLKKTVAQVSDFDGLEIASIISPDWNDDFVVAAEIMKSQGYDYKVGFRSEAAIAVLEVLRHSDMYMADSNLFPIESYPELRSIVVDMKDFHYNYTTHSYTHFKNRHSPVIQWLHNLVREILQEQAGNN